MMKRFYKKLIALAGSMLFGFSTSLGAQNLDANNKSAQSVSYYRNLILKNQELVKFVNITLERGHVPSYLRNLAIIESALDHQQVSSAGATGLWQFMSTYGVAYGVSADRRTDINKTTKAVVPSLKYLYRKFGNWITVAAAYNAGEGNVAKAIQKAGSKRYTDFEAYLPSETQNYVQKFLNACYATGELDQVLYDYYKVFPTSSVVVHKKAPIVPAKSTKTITPQRKVVTKKGFENIQINTAYNPKIIASYLKISESELYHWNPNLKTNLKTKGQSVLYLPANKMVEFHIHQNEILMKSL